MARTKRFVEVGYPHHIMQRGNANEQVFKDDEDRQVYLDYILKYSLEYGLSILCYCLMDNHVHFIAVPNKEDSLAKTFQYANTRYSNYFNRKNKRSGNLWQGRFYSCTLDNEHLYEAVRYVERNPVRKGLVQKPWDWKYSSTNAHLGNVKEDLFNLKSIFDYIDIMADEWKFYIDSAEDKIDMQLIRKHTSSGKPLVDEDFMSKLEAKHNTKLVLRPQGRPKIDKNKNRVAEEILI